jgi:uncharacterized damage-inducible protein DinB
MSEKRRLMEQLDRAYTAHTWCGPSLLESIAGVPAAKAAKRAMKGAHSIWELVEHVASWNEIVAERLEGGSPTVTPRRNFPPVTQKTPAAWKAAQVRLALSDVFPAAKLSRKRPKLNDSWAVLIHGQIQHQLYHAGQIALLRRGLGIPIES